MFSNHGVLELCVNNDGVFMSRVIDLASRRNAPDSLKLLSHPAGVILPFETPSDADLLIPEVRDAICSGSYSADIISPLSDAVLPGDRALVIGAGLGVVSSLAARDRTARVIAIEANTALIPYLRRVHAMNGVPWVEVVNAVLGAGRTGRVPFFIQRDIRASSLLPVNETWDHAMIVPLIDLNLILEEERINLIICDIPATSMQLLAQADLWSVDRILVNRTDAEEESEKETDAWFPLTRQGFTAERYGSSILFSRSSASRHNRTREISEVESAKSA